jgi:hypothetical protein
LNRRAGVGRKSLGCRRKKLCSIENAILDTEKDLRSALRFAMIDQREARKGSAPRLYACAAEGAE